MKNIQFSSESVCSGHPDKICDQVSDAILDKALEHDPYSRVAVETLVTKNKVVLAGEVTSKYSINYEEVIRNIVKKLGYGQKIYDFDESANIEVLIHEQSGDIGMGVDDGGAGDQGLMFGYATNETDCYMPLPIMMAHDLCRGMDSLSKDLNLRPDGKSQVTINYDKTGRPNDVEKIVLAKPFDYSKSSNLEIKELFYNKLVTPLLNKYSMPEIKESQIIFNGTGKWKIGGPAMDTGVTGRKIVVDTYGGVGRIGGGCFSGKDATKVDRSGAYAARYIAKNVVAAGLADRCEVQIAYAIGHKYPVGKYIYRNFWN